MLIEAGANAWSLALYDSPDMHIVQTWNTILQLFIIWLVGILFESGVDDGRTYRQVAGSWVCSWWVTAVGKVPTTLESGRLDTKSFQYKLKVRLHKNFDLFLVSKRPVTFYFFYVRLRSFPWFFLRHQQPWDHIKARAVRRLIALWLHDFLGLPQ